MRRILRAAYLGGKLGDTSALENPSAIGHDYLRRKSDNSVILTPNAFRGRDDTKTVHVADPCCLTFYLTTRG